MKVERDNIFGCLRMTEVDREGYGRIKGRLAHVVEWEKVNGPIPEGKELDHACRRRNCVRLAHLELVTRSENERRKAWASRARKQTCKAGHDLRVTAMVTPEGGRVCRTCSKGQ